MASMLTMPPGGVWRKRVVAQVGEDAGEHIGVCFDDGQIVGNGVTRLDIGTLKFGREYRQHLVNEGGQAYRFAQRSHSVRFRLPHQVQVFDQAAQAQRFTHNNTSRRLVIFTALVHAIHQ